jgi:hypothetical protein
MGSRSAAGVQRFGEITNFVLICSPKQKVHQSGVMHAHVWGWCYGDAHLRGWCCYVTPRGRKSKKEWRIFVCVVCLVGFVCFAVFTTAGWRKAVWSIHDQLAIMCLFMSGVLLPRTDTLYWSMAGMWHWLLAKLHCLNSFCCFFSTEM